MITCTECGEVEAPELGDMGMMGFPSLSTEERKNRRIPQNFGYLYEGFEAIGLYTESIDAFLRFLHDHAGHQLFITEEDESPYEKFEDKEWYQEAREETFGPLRPDDDLQYQSARFVAECSKCGESCESHSTDMARVAKSQQLPPGNIEAFYLRVHQRLNTDFDASHPFGPTDLHELGEFLKKHKDHAPGIRLVPA